MGLFRRRSRDERDADDRAAIAAAYQNAVGRFGLDDLDELARKCVDNVDEAAALNARYALTKVHERCFERAYASRTPRSFRSFDGLYEELLAGLASRFGLDPTMLAEADDCRRSYEYLQWLREQVADTAAQFDAGSAVHDEVDSLVDTVAAAQRKRVNGGIGDALYDGSLAGLADEVDRLAERTGRPGLPDPPR